jgi:hypothetical protein
VATKLRRASPHDAAFAAKSSLNPAAAKWLTDSWQEVWLPGPGPEMPAAPQQKPEQLRYFAHNV